MSNAWKTATNQECRNNKACANLMIFILVAEEVNRDHADKNAGVIQTLSYTLDTKDILCRSFANFKMRAHAPSSSSSVLAKQKRTRLSPLLS